MRVVAAVILEEGRVLACRRSPQKSFPGKWEFPGGKIEGSESPEAALRREVQEELGVDVNVGGLFRIDETNVGGLSIELHCYRVSFRGEHPIGSTDHDDLRWVDIREISTLDWAAPDIPMVRDLVAQARKEIKVNRRQE